jgi:hypothetical protein
MHYRAGAVRFGNVKGREIRWWSSASARADWFAVHPGGGRGWRPNDGLCLFPPPGQMAQGRSTRLKPERPHHADPVGEVEIIRGRRALVRHTAVRQGRMSLLPAMIPAAAERLRTGYTSMPRTTAPPAAFASGSSTARLPASRAAIAIGKVLLLGRTSPSRSSSPAIRHSSSFGGSTWFVATRMPNAIGSSKAGPALRTSAGARFTVRRANGNVKPLFLIALRTRSRISCTYRWHAHHRKPHLIPLGADHVHLHFDQVPVVAQHPRCRFPPTRLLPCRKVSRSDHCLPAQWSDVLPPRNTRAHRRTLASTGEPQLSRLVLT